MKTDAASVSRASEVVIVQVSDDRFMPLMTISAA